MVGCEYWLVSEATSRIAGQPNIPVQRRLGNVAQNLIEQDSLVRLQPSLYGKRENDAVHYTDTSMPPSQTCAGGTTMHLKVLGSKTCTPYGR